MELAERNTPCPHGGGHAAHIAVLTSCIKELHPSTLLRELRRDVEVHLLQQPHRPCRLF